MDLISPLCNSNTPRQPGAVFTSPKWPYRRKKHQCRTALFFFFKRGLVPCRPSREISQEEWWRKPKLVFLNYQMLYQQLLMQLGESCLNSIGPSFLIPHFLFKWRKCACLCIFHSSGSQAYPLGPVCGLHVFLHSSITSISSIKGG